MMPSFFFDYINLSINAGAVSSAPERTIANLLNPYMDEITVLGATTSEGFKAMLKNNLSFTQRFVKVDIPETSPEDTLAILKNIQDDLALKHQYGTFFDNGVFETLVDLAERFYRNRYFPGKAFEILKEITSTKIASHDKKEFFTTINKDDVFNVFKRRTGLPESIIFRDKVLDKFSITSFFNQRIFGQNKAIEAIVNAITMLKSEMNDPKKPIATLFFAGPTGVGKTYLSRLLAEYLFGSDDKLLRYDMAEYSTWESISKLIGGPLSSTKGKLIEDVSINPFSVILFDEIEKAHPEIFNLLLSLTGEGRLTDHTGRTIDFCNTIVIMTSNIGAEIYGKTNIGLVPGDEKNYFEKTLIDKIADYFAPEFINRLTEIIAFRPLSKVSIEAVANNEIQRLHKRKGLAARNIKLRITKNMMNFLVDNGYSERFGARPMQRTVERYIGLLVGNAIIEGKIPDNSQLILDIKNNTVKMKRIIEINKTHD